MTAGKAEVEVVYRAADFRALYSACGRCRSGLLFLALAPAAVILAIDLVTGTSLLAELPFLVGLVCAGLLVAAAAYWFGSLWQVRSRKRIGWSVPMRFALTDEAVTMIHPKQSSQWPWAAIVRVVAKRGRLFLFTSPASAIIIPSREFGSEAEFVDFASTAEAQWAHHHRL